MHRACCKDSINFQTTLKKLDKVYSMMTFTTCACVFDVMCKK